MIGASGLVNDGLTADGRNNGGTTWTYNQGVILGGLAALHEITGDRAYLDRGRVHRRRRPERAGRAAGHPHRAARGRHRARGTGTGRSSRGSSSATCTTSARSAGGRPTRAFILRNARSVCASNRNAAGQFGLRWAGPFDRADAARQTSALDALNAAVALTARLTRAPAPLPGPGPRR